MPQDLRSHLTEAASFLHQHRDIVEHRVTKPAVPGWCDRRDWSEFLLSLPDSVLPCCEANGLASVLAARSDAPPSLVEYVARVASLTKLPCLERADGELEPAEQRRVKARKRKQLTALLGAASELASGADRIVDVGSGQGHLTRAAARAWDKGAVGLDRQAPLIDVARELAADRRVRFQRWNAFDEALELAPTDLVTGLHACGEVGDILVQGACVARASVLLVSCCPQKVRAEVRRPLSETAHELIFTRPVLGLANLSQLERGVEATLADTMRSRQTRHALRLLLMHRGLAIEPGEEMRGLNRRRAYHGLGNVANLALALRDLPPATEDELRTFERAGIEQFGIMRRLSLPRTVLARLLEVAIVLDRAVYLIERGYRVRVAEVFPTDVSPRNLGLFADPETTHRRRARPLTSEARGR